MTSKCVNCRKELQLEDSEHNHEYYRCTDRKNCNADYIEVYYGEKKTEDSHGDPNAPKMTCTHCDNQLIVHPMLDCDLQDPIANTGTETYEGVCLNPECKVDFVCATFWFQYTDEEEGPG